MSKAPLFDKLCDLAERLSKGMICNRSNWKDRMQADNIHEWMAWYAWFYRRASLFKLDFEWKFSAEHTFEIQDHTGPDGELFHLPFPVTAIEDNESVLVFADEPDEEIVGFNAWRFCIDFRKVSEEEVPEVIQFMRTQLKGHELAKFNREKNIESFKRRGMYMLRPMHFKGEGKDENGQFIVGIKNTKWDAVILNREIAVSFASEVLCKTGLNDIGTGLEQICYITSPKRFVIEESPLQQKARDKRLKKKNPGRIERSHQRSLYTVLAPGEITTRYGLGGAAGGTGRTPSAHQRRRHLRTYRHARYGAMRGKTVVIPACWVGKRSTEIGGKRYEVRLDL